MGITKTNMMEETENVRILEGFLHAEPIPDDITYDCEGEEECITYNRMCSAITWSLKEIEFWRNEFFKLKQT